VNRELSCLKHIFNLGIKWGEIDVFYKKDGQRYRSVRTAFELAVKRAHIPHIRFHDLRHTFATRLIMGGVDLFTVQELLRHKSLFMTKRYSHPTPEHKKHAVTVLMGGEEQAQFKHNLGKVHSAGNV
jgi:integrase